MGFWKRIFRSNIAFFSLEEAFEYAESDFEASIQPQLDRVRVILRDDGVDLKKTRSIEDFAYWANQIACLAHPHWETTSDICRRKNAFATYILVSFELETGLTMRDQMHQLNYIEQNSI